MHNYHLLMAITRPPWSHQLLDSFILISCAGSSSFTVLFSSSQSSAGWEAGTSGDSKSLAPTHTQSFPFIAERTLTIIRAASGPASCFFVFFPFVLFFLVTIRAVGQFMSYASRPALRRETILLPKGRTIKINTSSFPSLRFCGRRVSLDRETYEQWSYKH